MLYIALTQNDILMIGNDEHSPMLLGLSEIKQIEGISSILHKSDTEHVVVLNDESLLPKYFSIINIRFVLNHVDIDTATRIVYYQQLLQYYTSNKFCGSCGVATIRQNTNKFVFCSNCQSEIYPRIAPCIMVRIHKNNDILMARGVNFPKGRWGLIAGFVEIGETLEEAVIREVKEEVGLEICEINYWGSQPWSFPNTTLMVGFTANYKSGELVLDNTEIEEAGFFNATNIPGTPSSQFSIAAKLINDFLKKESI